MPRRKRITIPVCACPSCGASAFIGGSKEQPIVCCFTCGEFPYRAMFPKQLLRGAAHDQMRYEAPQRRD